MQFRISVPMAFLNQIFKYENVDDSGSYTTGEAGTTYIYIAQLIIELICLIYVYVKVK